MKHFKSIIATSICLTLGTGMALAETKWDMSTAWPAGNFHAKNAMTFADAVREATDGSVDITVHVGGEIGVKVTEKMSAVETGVVQMADMLLFLQAGSSAEPLLSMDTLPYLIQGQEEMKAFLEVAGPVFDKIAADHNQKILYYVPWPSPGVYSKQAIVSANDMSGQRIRAFNAASYEFLEKLGAAPLEMPWGDVAAAAAAGTIDGAATSSSSGVDGKLWQFTDHFNPLNWSTSTDAVTVNLDAWNALTDQEREVIQGLADKMEAEFWAVSAAEDEGKIAILEQNGMTVSAADDSLKAKMAEAGKSMWADYISKNPDAKPIIDAYSAKLGK